MLLDLQLGLNADVFEEALHQLRVIDEIATEPTGDGTVCLKPLGVPGLRQQALGFFGIVAIEFGTLAKLLDGQRPLGQAGLQQLATAQTMGLWGIDRPCPHGSSSLWQCSVPVEVTSGSPPAASSSPG
jgi:hypothetical protein